MFSAISKGKPKAYSILPPPMLEPMKKSGAKQGFNDFVASNHYVSKFAFVILIVILFISVLQLGVLLIELIFSPSEDVYLTKKLNDASQYIIVPQDPKKRDSRPISRSVNKTKGIEFTWSIWLFIKPTNPPPDKQYLHVFHKGNNDFSEEQHNGLNYPNNAPGLYIDHVRNEFVIIMNTYTHIIEKIRVSDVPLNKWVNVMIRCQQNIIDVYVNGSVIKRHELTDVPKQNYGDVYVTANGGFNGYTSELRYFGSALSPGKIIDIVNHGPNLENDDVSNYKNNMPPYLSLRWYFDDTAYHTAQ